jgi:hypothetical protein
MEDIELADPFGVQTRRTVDVLPDPIHRRYTSLMRSRSATAIDSLRAERLAAMTPDARVVLAARLGEESLALFMAVHDVDRATAVARVKATRRLGRRRSASADPDEP